MSPESENESLITVKGRQSMLISFSLTLLLLRGNSTSALAHRHHRTDPVTGERSLLQVSFPGIRWQTSHKSRRSQQWRHTATRSQAWSLDSCYGHFPQFTGMRVISTPLLLLLWPFIQSWILSSFTNEWVTWSFTFTHPNLSIPTHNPLATLSVGIC